VLIKLLDPIIPGFINQSLLQSTPLTQSALMIFNEAASYLLIFAKAKILACSNLNDLANVLNI
jgi:hypothetical protein